MTAGAIGVAPWIRPPVTAAPVALTARLPTAAPFNPRSPVGPPLPLALHARAKRRAVAVVERFAGERLLRRRAERGRAAGDSRRLTRVNAVEPALQTAAVAAVHSRQRGAGQLLAALERAVGVLRHL